MLRRRKVKGQSLIEFTMLVVLILGALFVFQKYITRGLTGRWKAVGESLGQGRIYDPRLTTECIFDPLYTNLWYDKACFDSQGCDCLSARANAATCEGCFNVACTTIVCNN